MCLYGETMVRRDALLVFGDDFENSVVESVPPERQCRGHLDAYGHTLASAGCVSAEDAELAVRCVVMVGKAHHLPLL